jgi:hypothetical protein
MMREPEPRDRSVDEPHNQHRGSYRGREFDQLHEREWIFVPNDPTTPRSSETLLALDVVKRLRGHVSDIRFPPKETFSRVIGNPAAPSLVTASSRGGMIPSMFNLDFRFVATVVITVAVLWVIVRSIRGFKHK